MVPTVKSKINLKRKILCDLLNPQNLQSLELELEVQVPRGIAQLRVVALQPAAAVAVQLHGF